MALLRALEVLRQYLLGRHLDPDPAETIQRPRRELQAYDLQGLPVVGRTLQVQTLQRTLGLRGQAPGRAREQYPRLR